jgi:hypothetical protein
MKQKLTLTFTLLLLIVFAFAGNGGHKRKVLIIGVDGCRADALKQEMDSGRAPNLAWLAANGFYTLDSWHEDITISGPSWSSIMCGVYHLKHGVTGNTYSGSNYNAYPYFPTHAKEIDSTFKCVQYTEWAPMSNNVYNDGWDQKIIGTDGYSQGTGAAAVGLIQDPNTDLLFTYFDKVDLTGHSSGFSPANPAYNQAIDSVDVQVGKIIQAMRSRPTYAQEDWLVLVVTDHGGTGTGHGGESYEERHIWWIGFSERCIKSQVSGPQNLAHTNPPDPGELALYPLTNIDTAIGHQSPVQADIAVTALHHLIYESGINPETHSPWVFEGRSWLCAMGLCDNLTGIDDASPDTKLLTLSPNPVCSNLSITTKAAAALQVYNSLGALMLQTNCPTGTTELNTAFLTPGIYFVKIQFDDKTIAAKRFIKE